MRRFLFLYLICALLQLFTVFGHGQSTDWAERYNFTALCMNEGLPCNYVDDIIKDSRGFLWIATPGAGISRYDGYDFLVCNMATLSTKLKSNFVRSLCEDNFGRIWAGSEMGIDIINIYNLEIEQIPGDETKLLPLYNFPVHYIYKSKSGHLWIASENCLYRLRFHSDGTINDIQKVYESTIINDQIKTMVEIDDQIFFNDGENILSVKEDASGYSSAQINHFLHFDVPNAWIQTIYIRDNELWAGTLSGLFRYNLTSKSLRHYYHDPADIKSLSQNCITDINETDDHFIIIATLRGLNIYNAITDNFERIDKDRNDNESNFYLSNRLNCDFINCLLPDGDIIWIGTEVGGLNKISHRKLYVENYFHSASHSESISKNPVNAIYEDKQGTLWVGTVEGGLNRKTRRDNHFTHYTMDTPCNLSHNSVSCFTTDSQDRLWVGTWGGGVGWIERKPGDQLVFHHITDDNFIDLANSLVGIICYDSVNNAIWIGASNRIYVYEIHTGRVLEPFRGLNIGGVDGCAGYCIDRNNKLWIGLSSGLCSIDLYTLHAPRMVYQLWRNKLDEPESKIRERVTYIAESEDGTIWIGSNGYGLYQSFLDANGEYGFKAFTTSDGLINNSIRGIQEDNNGNIWISTTNGLSCYHRESYSFINYTEKDGLGCSQFYWNAIHKGSNGDLYVGSVNGLSIVKPEIQMTGLDEMQMAFTHVRVADKEIYPTDNKLVLHEKDKSLYIEFAALDYNLSDFSTYYYRLKGFDDRWIKVSANRRSAAFTNLTPGTYHFELHYAPDGKNWLDNSSQLTIEVLPYFYKTPWFIALMFSLIVLGAYQAWNWRIRLLKAQQELLHKKVEERTHELQEKQKLLTLQTDELYRQNDLLKQQNEKITKQKAQILTMSKKVQELTLDKLSFFTNITHEFRTPLTLIIGPIERALKLSYNPQVIEQLNFVERNSKYLLSLVNQLMDFRKVESGNMEILLKAGDLRKFFEEIIVPFRAFANDREITINSCMRLPDRPIMFDEDAMRKVMINLIGNALKFTPKGGIVSVFITTRMINNIPSLFIGVKDTGSGIPEEDQKRIFNRFFQSNNKSQESFTGQSGTGIGLYLCKRIIHLYNGTIEVKNNRDKGCSFRVSLPLQFAENTPLKSVTNYIIEEDKEEIQTITTNAQMTILVVEDNVDMRNYISSILRESYTIIEAGDGKEALEALRKQSVDFIISDLMMPVMDGLELSRQVKADFTLSHIPFLMLTAKTSEESRCEGFKMGVDEYLLKPFDEKLLLARIDNLLENRKRLQQKFSVSMEVDSLNIDEESGDKKFLDKVMKVVKDNYKNSYWEVSDFIEEMGVSKSLMNKKMQTLTGQSAGQFIRNYRLNIARELLSRNAKTKSMNISEIAYEVGYNDPKYFTRCFSKQFGVTPSSLIED